MTSLVSHFIHFCILKSTQYKGVTNTPSMIFYQCLLIRFAIVQFWLWYVCHEIYGKYPGDAGRHFFSGLAVFPCYYFTCLCQSLADFFLFLFPVQFADRSDASCRGAICFNRKYREKHRCNGGTRAGTHPVHLMWNESMCLDFLGFCLWGLSCWNRKGWILGIFFPSWGGFEMKAHGETLEGLLASMLFFVGLSCICLE